jgi:acetylornithine/N-succinyldiaminopimelate aminotransferase
VLDEVQSGIGRTGRLFAHEWAGITPDVMAVAKGLGGGFPIGACLATEAAGAGMTAGSHGSTFGGNPLAVAVGNAVLDIVLEPGFLERVAAMGLRLKQHLAALKDSHHAVIAEVRGEGLMLGLKCKVPNTLLVQKLREDGMLVVPAGDNVVRLLPPLIIDEPEIEHAAWTRRDHRRHGACFVALRRCDSAAHGSPRDADRACRECHGAGDQWAHVLLPSLPGHGRHHDLRGT